MQGKQANRVLPQVPAVSELIEDLERRLLGSYAPDVRRTNEPKLAEQIAILATDTDDLIRSMGFEPLPIERCRQRNKELWENSLLGRKKTCHGCGNKVTEFYMLYIAKDNRKQIDHLNDALVKGHETFSSYNEKFEALIQAEHPDDGWYCTHSCYQSNSNRHADPV